MIFMDTASTTKVKPKVRTVVNKYLDNNYANPLAMYEFAQESSQAIAKSRSKIAEILKCNSEEIYFTSGGSEANNMAIKGFAFQYFKNNKKPFNLITTPIEHHSVLNACKELEELEIVTVSYLPVKKTGEVDYNDLESLITSDTKLITISWANNEIGTIQNIPKLAEIAHKHGIIFHTDAVQAYCKIPIIIDNVDMLSASGHKWGAPKGIGFLYKRNEVDIAPLINGGNQERGLRGGTHNVPYIAGMGTASELAFINQKHNNEKENIIKETLRLGLHIELPKLKVNGIEEGGLPNILNLCFSEYGVRGEELLAFLSENGICVSTGSACATGEPSHVLKAIGLTEEEIDASVRFSFNEDNSVKDIDTIINTIVNGVKLLGR